MVVSSCSSVVLFHFYLHFVAVEFFFIVVVVIILRIKWVLTAILVYWFLHGIIELGLTIVCLPFGSSTKYPHSQEPTIMPDV